MEQNITFPGNKGSDAYSTLSVKDFADRIAFNDVFLLDVRHPDEFSQGHIKGAINIDVTAPDFLNEAKELLPKEKTIAVYCRSGKRSAMASELLSENGYNVLNLGGGILNWEASGEPTVK